MKLGVICLAETLVNSSLMANLFLTKTNKKTPCKGR